MNAVSNLSFTMKSYVHPSEFLAGISWSAGNTAWFPCDFVSCSLLMHMHCCCWNGLAGSSQYCVKILHVFTPIYIYIYIYYTHQLWWNILNWRAILSKYNMLLVKGQVFNGNVGHFRILQKCYKQCMVLAIYRFLFFPKLIRTPLK
jgi:hypothetical protein